MLVRQELGPGAAVLHTREVPRRGLRGWLGARELELAASDGSNVPTRLPNEMHQFTAPTKLARPVVPMTKVEPERLIESFHLSMEKASPELLDEPNDKGLDLSRLADDGTLWDRLRFAPAEDKVWIEQLRKREVADGMIRKLVEQLQANPLSSGNAVKREDIVRQAIAGQLPVGRDLDAPESTARVIAAIGPTGVGKTTTIAKLAARAKFDQRKRVGLVTVDTFRIAAVDQLHTYAEIMGLPMRVVGSPVEIRSAIDSLSDCDQIFIDTAGRSPRDEVQVQQLRAILTAACPDETYLVVSATSGGKVLKEVRDQFGRVQPTAMVLTKLDEVETIGNALEFLATASMPISYVTNGQDVPHAIDLAHAEDLARRIL